MAFLRKHRDRYLLVHNFRQGSKVHQVRIYAFDLQAEIDAELSQAKQAMAALPYSHLPMTWLEPVRQQLQRLQTERQQQHRAQQSRQVQQHLDHLTQALEALGETLEQQQMVQTCLGRLQQMVPRVPEPKTPPRLMTPRLHPQPDMPAAVASDAILSQGREIEPRLYVYAHRLYHRCPSAEPLLPENLADPHGPAALAPVCQIALINGRDLWLACTHCQTRWPQVPALTHWPQVSLPRRRISRFERFCLEHHVGEACFMLIRYGSGHIERLAGTIATLDDERQRIQVSVTHRHTTQTYWRHCAHVYFGTLEVQLTAEQYASLLAMGMEAPVPLTGHWYNVPDTPAMRLALQERGVRY